ncbi:MAG TPA: hypothetical protein VF960_08100 [Chloroflexota bacterium]
MVVSTDRFRVLSVRPSASGQYEGVPEELLEMVEGKVLVAEELEGLGVEVKNARLYHGGDGIAVVEWQGEEFVLNLEPVESQ